MKLKNYLLAILSKNHSNESYHGGPVKIGEPFVRYISNEKLIDDKKRVRQGAFSPHGQRRDLSVCRSENSSYDILKYLGQKYVGDPSGRKILAWAEFNSDIVRNYNLILNPDGKPFKRHLNIEQWPSDSSACLMIKLELANNSNTTIVT